MKHICPIRPGVDRNFPSAVPSAYLRLHLVLSMTGIYSFLPNLWYGPNLLEYVGFIVLLVALTMEPGNLRLTGAVLPCAVIILFYFSFGLAVSPHMDHHLRPAVYSMVSLTFLVIALPAAIADEADLRRFATDVQLAAIGCLAVCVAEGTIPKVAEFLAQSKLPAGEISYHAFRTSGFLRNPNESANFFILTFLLSHWCPGVLRTCGRIASIYGVYLSASRSGAFLLGSCFILYAAGTMIFPVSSAARGRGGAIFTFLAIGFLVLGSIKLVSPGLFSRTEAGMSRAQRILTSQAGMGERTTVTEYWLPKALDAPIYGHGLRSFQSGPPYGLSSRTISNQGTHNAWLMLLGEIGPLGPAAYMAVLMAALSRILRLSGRPMDRFVLMLMWFSFVAFSFKAHTLFDFRYYTVALSLLLFLPRLLSAKTPDQEADPEGSGC